MKRKKIILLSLAVILLAAGAVWLTRLRSKGRREVVNNDAGFIAHVKVEKRKSGEDTVVSINNFWFKSSVIYALDVETFRDSDGDGTGDLKGLIQKLDYLKGLGIDAIWLAPFQPTPNRDDGYDIINYYAIDDRLGTMADFNKLIQEANKRGLRIIMDLVVNHTSNQHPWFVQGRNPGNAFHNWYVWSKEKPDNINQGMAFPGVQSSMWSYDSVATAYYHHSFYDFQPDLNTQNDSVVAEVIRVVNFWMDKGVAGFRLYGAPSFIEVPETKGERFEQQYALLTELRHVVQAKRADGIIMGEANVMPSAVEPYFGKNGNGLHLLLNSYANQYLFYALATGDVDGLADALNATRDIPFRSQWSQVLRNHDELDLSKLSNKERDKVYQAFGPDSSMQLYGRGIRRRLAPMLNNDRRKLELAYSLLFALPSTPVIGYGDEIGMGDDLMLKERESVRTPMQWTDSSKGGFSKASQTVRPIIDTGDYSYKLVNVRNQLTDSGSLLNWTIRMISLRDSLPGQGRGAWKLIPSGSSHVLAMQYEWEGESLITFHNFSEVAQEVKIKSDKETQTLDNLLKSEEIFISANAPFSYNLEGLGYRWYKIR
ncbi:MAG: alpha-amylase family protein [Niastella sp.]|nr:alpha-amylase family protein [Niastella sp.]